MPSVVQPRSYRRMLFTVSGFVVFVALAISGFWAYRIIAANSDSQEYASTQKIANLDAAAGKFDEAATLWTAYASKSPNKDHQYQALLQAGSLYITNGQYALAARSCQQAEKVKGVTFQEAEVAAAAYSRLGQKDQAVHYYREAIRLEPASSADAVADKAGFTRAIAQLSATP